jgi:hypothetical protein
MEIFRTRMVPLFPLVVIPDHITSEQLRHEKPFLYLNISMVACQNAPRQREIASIVKGYVAEHIVLRGEQSLDLLQGLLVHLAWFIPVSRLPRLDFAGQIIDSGNPEPTAIKHASGVAQLDAFVQLARAQAISLGLNQEQNVMRSLDKPIVYLRQLDFERHDIPVRTLEERRASLGCYYVIAMYVFCPRLPTRSNTDCKRLSACVRDMEPLRFTKYSNECCQVLQETSEFPTDAFLVHLVRSMHLADKINRTFAIHDYDSSTALSAPLGMSVKWHQAELQQLRASCSCEPPHSSTYSSNLSTSTQKLIAIGETAILFFHYDTLELLLYKIALSEELSDAQYGEYPVTRLDLLFRCLEATKSFFFNYYSLPSVYFPFLPFASWCQFGQAIVALSRLSLYQSDHGECDRAYVQSTIDFNQTVDEVGQKLEEVRPSTGQGVERPEIYERMENRMHLMKKTHRKRRGAQERNQPLAPQPPDFTFMFNMPMGTFFPYTEFGGLPDAFEAPVDNQLPIDLG